MSNGVALAKLSVMSKRRKTPAMNSENPRIVS